MTRKRSEFQNELNENKVQFTRIRDKNVNFCYIYKKSVLSFYFEIDIERN